MPAMQLPPSKAPNSWTAYRLALLLESPVHSGYRTAGNLKQTRPYVTGSTLWGAMAARIARDHLQRRYKDAQDWIQRHLRFTYLYPSTNPNRITSWPWGASQREFEWQHLGSYVSTALENGRSGLEGSLHETEHISPVTRSGEPVYLIGYLWINGVTDVPWLSGGELQELFTRVQIGGERTYGWGRVRGVTLNGVEPRAVDLFGEWTAEAADGGIRVRPRSRSSPLLAHAIAATGADAPLVEQGALEPFLARRIDRTEGNRGHGLHLVHNCWSPGTVIPRAVAYEIGELGIWRPVQTQRTEQMT